MRRPWTILALAAALLAAPVAARADPPPAPVITSGPDGPTNNPAPTFELTPATVASCEVDGPAGPVETVSPCTSPHTTPHLDDGDYVLYVRATNDTGESTEATRAFRVDTVAPDTSIGGGPRALTNQRTAAFALTASERESTFECRLTGPGHAGDFTACAAYENLADGDYTFAARAVDAAGNVDATPATWTFTVDTTPPAAPALSATPGGFAFASEPGATFECALDTPTGAGAFAPCTSPRSYSGLAAGEYTLRVRATDAAGNTGAAAALAFTVAAPTPVPVFHASVVARPGQADVRVRVPGSPGYVALTTDRALPLGSLVDTRRGAVQLVSVARRGGKLQRANFGGAVFRVTQPAAATVLTLSGPCRPAEQLSGEGRGAFEVRGRYGTATVRAARWVVRDSCSGTLTRALEGVVQVRDRARRRTVLLRAGRGYIAKRR